MQASLSSGLAYQPADQAGKPPPGLSALSAAELADSLLRTEPGPALPGGPISVPVGRGVEHAGQQPGTQTILPEPATIAILGLGLLSLAFLRRGGA